MNQLLSDSLWPTIKKLARKCEIRRAAVAYVTTDEYIRFSHGDLLITDASDAAIRGGLTRATLLAEAVRRGAEVYSLPGLHAKIVVLDRTAIIGSANLSQSSASELIEAAWVSDDPDASSLATATILSMRDQASRVDDTFLKHILSLKIAAKPRGIVSRRANSQKRPEPNHRTWIVGLHELPQTASGETVTVQQGVHIAENRRSHEDSDVSWARITGKSKFRLKATRGDSVIEIWRSAGSEVPEAVFKPAPILHRQDEPKCTRFWLERYADADDSSLTWSQFQDLASQAKLPKIAPNSMRELSEHHAKAIATYWDGYLTNSSRGGE